MKRSITIIKYVTGFTIPVMAFLSMQLGGYWVFLTPVYAFIFLSGLELILPVNKYNLSALEEAIEKKDTLYDWFLYFHVPVQYALMIWFLHLITSGSYTGMEITGMTISMGICCGVIGINVAHELGHRKSSLERFLSKSLLLTSLYMHFIIEHNKGHHKNVSTPDDPSSARLNEPVYLFYFRTILGSLQSAWNIQKKELSDGGFKMISPQNEFLIFLILELLAIVIVGIVFNWLAVICFISAAFLGILLLESVNYIEHYGLKRNHSISGMYERVQPWHSWNSDHVIGRLVLYELTRHSDHHFQASRKYQILRHREEAPQLPAGYPAMIILSLCPPLYFKIMNPRVQKVLLLHSS